ncbi:hypothetical protein CCGE525_08990 [Rhizobium jaguaris]|uniref:Uncharacterized protein n=1 Tax=Rhizobium jaguaris TaxID=1312183 RepID=A0A387FPT2_9HYPH|nr:hypothetical protein CCGE525_08990 [Rhizobium jaguaris]
MTGGAATIAVAIFFGGLIDAVVPLPAFVGEAQARVGHPLTPGSAAGVARRTTRRTIRRTNVYVNSLPAGCAKTSAYGPVLWQCGGRYYQASGGRYVVVNIQ